MISGGIICLSLVNSIFVDSMVADNIEPLDKKISFLKDKIDKVLEKINQK